MARTVADTTRGSSFPERVAAHYDNLAPAERRVAEHLLELGPPALVLSAVALGKELGTSDATVVRTAKALGYQSLGDLRHDLASAGATASPETRLRRTLEHSDPSDLLTTFASEQIRNLELLSQAVTQADFNRAAQLLHVADRIVWRGVGPSARLAQYGELLSNRVGKTSTSFVHSGTSFADELLGLRAGDAVVLLAYGALQAHVSVMLERAADLDAPVVLITDTLGRRLARRVAVTLRSGRGTPGEFASHTSTLVLVEALTLAVADHDRVRATSTLRTLNDLRAGVVGRRIDVDTRT